MLKVLMISIDRGLLGKGQLGDVIERHRRYGEFVDRLDIIVFSPQGYGNFELSKKVSTYPTSSSTKVKRIFDALRIGKKLCSQTKYDLIIAMDPFFTGFVATRLKKKFGVKFLVHFHGDFWGNPLNPSLKMLSRYVVHNADAVRVMSEGQRDSLTKAGIIEKKIHIISTPVDLQKFMNDIDAVPTGAPPQQTVLHVGRYDTVKDFVILGKAWQVVSKKIPNARFLQIGGGQKALDEIKSGGLVSMSKENVLDRSMQEELLQYYRQTNVVVLSSRSESFGKVLVEANACGKPVVSTATTGAKEIIKDGVNGYLVPIGDAQALADKIIYLLEHPDEAKAMGEMGRELARGRFGSNTEKIIQLWHEVSGV